MRRHLLILLLRMFLASGVALALPFSCAQWGGMYPGDGQNAFGFLIIFAVIGVVAAAVFVALGSLAHFFFRRKQARVTVLADLVLFVLFVGVLVYEGTAVRYTDTTPEKSATMEKLFVAQAFDGIQGHHCRGDLRAPCFFFAPSREPI